MAGKNVYKVGAYGDANYPNLTSIPTEILTQGDTSFIIYPGTYTAPTAVQLDDVAFIGLGDREEIVISGAMTIANTSANSAVFENLTFTGADATAASGSACVTKLGAASMPLTFNRVVFGNADFAVVHNAERAFATTAKQVTINYSDATAVDRAVSANANVAINFSALNTSANAYFTPGTGGGNPAVTVTVRASTSGGSNTGNCTKTVLALVS